MVKDCVRPPALACWIAERVGSSERRFRKGRGVPAREGPGQGREQDRAAAAKEGIIEAYIHPGSRVAVARRAQLRVRLRGPHEEFKDLAHDLAMQVVASRPQYVRPEDVPAEVLEKERAIYRAQVTGRGQAGSRGREDRRGQAGQVLRGSLPDEAAVHQGRQSRPSKNWSWHMIAKIGENIVVRRFVRFELGEAFERRDVSQARVSRSAITLACSLVHPRPGQARKYCDEEQRWNARS